MFFPGLDVLGVGFCVRHFSPRDEPSVGTYIIEGNMWETHVVLLARFLFTKSSVLAAHGFWSLQLRSSERRLRHFL